MALVFAVTAWSAAPLWIFQSRGLLPAPVAALVALTIATTLALALTSFSRNLNIVAAVRATHQRKLIKSAFGVGALAYFAYPLLYFSALQTGPPLMVNLINYLWPIIGLLMASAMRRENRALEVLMAAGFGFAGAALAILNGARGDSLISKLSNPLPLALAALGAISYATMSAFMNAAVPRQEGPFAMQFFLVALCVGGSACGLTLAAVAVMSPGSVTLHLAGGHPWALLVYAVLHPFSHLAWMIAIQAREIPGFTSLFLVPVFSTIILAVALKGVVGPQIISALTLVLCGILFSSVRDRGVPVVFAAVLAGLGSLMVSVSLPVGGVDEMLSITEVFVGLFAIFGGFVLSNSIGRYANLQKECEAFYAKAQGLIDSDSGRAEEVHVNLDRLDTRVIESTRLEHKALLAPAWRPFVGLSREWARVDLALSTRVSPYEWLVLLLGAAGVILTMHVAPVGSQLLTMALARGLATAMVVGLLFAVRDYDMNRPNLMLSNLESLHLHFGVTVRPETTLGALLDARRTRELDWMAVALVILVAASCISVIMNVR
ncbi:EamA family transporter [Catellatospora tritici]|uniref:EamA family transporter n=1 Tax=Catellatospora tritici TaxID=2851566 RepID=UPI001C2D9DC7|nr:EamA family transporter [Catellatospora tritici]